MTGAPHAEAHADHAVHAHGHGSHHAHDQECGCGHDHGPSKDFDTSALISARGLTKKRGRPPGPRPRRMSISIRARS